MNLFELAESLGSKMKWYDFSLLKLSMLFFTLFLVTAWTGFRELALSFAWYWHLIIAIVVALPLIKKMFSD